MSTSVVVRKVARSRPVLLYLLPTIAFTIIGTGLSLLLYHLPILKQAAKLPIPEIFPILFLGGLSMTFFNPASSVLALIINNLISLRFRGYGVGLVLRSSLFCLLGQILFCGLMYVGLWFNWGDYNYMLSPAAAQCRAAHGWSWSCIDF